MVYTRCFELQFPLTKLQDISLGKLSWRQEIFFILALSLGKPCVLGLFKIYILSSETWSFILRQTYNRL